MAFWRCCFYRIVLEMLRDMTTDDLRDFRVDSFGCGVK